MASGNVYNVIWDHVTARWWGNKPFVTTANSGSTIQNITGQWLLLYEPNKTHPVVIALDATSGSALSSINQDFHHNMAVNYQHRWPLTNIHSMRWVNNLSYNNLQNTSDFSSLAWGGLMGDYIGNKYVDGPQSVIKVHTFLFNSNQGGADSSNNCTGSNPCDNPGPPSIYLLNNIGHVGNQTGGDVEGATHVVNDATQIDQAYQGWEGGEQPKDGITIAPVPSGVVSRDAVAGGGVPDRRGSGRKFGRDPVADGREFAPARMRRHVGRVARFAGCAHHRAVSGGRRRHDVHGAVRGAGDHKRDAVRRVATRRHPRPVEAGAKAQHERLEPVQKARAQRLHLAGDLSERQLKHRVRRVVATYGAVAAFEMSVMDL